MQNGDIDEELACSEKEVERNQDRKSSKVSIKHLPPETTKEKIEELIDSFGKISRCDIITPNPDQKVAYITFESSDEAIQALENLNNKEYEGRNLSVELVTGSKSKRGQHAGRFGGRGTGYPLRILVPSDFVGAIIGRKGQTIKNITTQSRARVDVHCKENTGLLEKVISIYGQPDNCSNACKEILRVMQQESENANRGEVALKMLAEDRHCGRIIGKKGTVIKQIRSETDTKIYVSNLQDVPAVFPDRVITINGELERMQKAENIISSKLRECYDKESVSPGVHAPYIPPPPSGLMTPYRMPFMPPPTYMQQQPVPFQLPPLPFGDSCQVHVPHTSVGAIIGAGGSSIKQIIRQSGAFVAVEQKADENTTNERIVTIKGLMDAQCRALYQLYERVNSDVYAGFETCRLRITIRVPRSMVGRVIGKNGKNVRDVQRMTGAIIKLPDETSGGEDTPVDVFGNFMSVQQAMYQVRTLIATAPGRQD